ncbi:hypothetical protein [Amycolatopsis sp. Hca4]|uniref:hypothetical protein n=1 Tax=Amycolatopsis sp. Hca4 TaxID=2742131 RepID=UPI0015914B46|nr:hypothetical protein [Amycolatopsis sp. Hca4]QKV73651.1 hypothetical protein HUT10_07575 [Amycolatopsis sp. Hca4]
MNDADRMVLSLLCEDLHGLRQVCHQQGQLQQNLLRRIEAEALRRRPVATLLAELVGSPPEDLVAARRGLAAGLSGFSQGKADDEVFVCPDAACDRQVRVAPAGAPPRCLLANTFMRRL